MAITEIFNELGLRDEHARLYLAGLEWGETSITNLAGKAKVARTSAYNLIQDLIEAGLMRKSLKRGSKNYSAVEPSALLTILKKKELELQRSINNLSSTVMDQLNAIQNTRKKGPKLHYLEGTEGIKQAYEKTFEAEEISIQCFTEDYGEVVGEEWFNDYFDRFFSSNIRSRELLKAENEGDGIYMKKYGSSKNLQLRVKNSVPTETDFMVYDNTVIFVSFNKENPYALVVEDIDIASCVQNMFNLAWQEASRSDPRVLKGEKVKTEF